MKVTKSVTLDTVRDKRILDLAAKGNFSKTVRAALRLYLDLETGVTLGMVYSRLGDIERRLDSGVVVGSSQDGDDSVEGDTLSPDVLSAFE